MFFNSIFISLMFYLWGLELLLLRFFCFIMGLQQVFFVKVLMMSFLLIVDLWKKLFIQMILFVLVSCCFWVFGSILVDVYHL